MLTQIIIVKYCASSNLFCTPGAHLVIADIRIFSYHYLHFYILKYFFLNAVFLFCENLYIVLLTASKEDWYQDTPKLMWDTKKSPMGMLQ